MGRERTSRLTVEETPIYLSATELCSAGVFRLPAGTRATASWPRTGPSLGSLRFEIRADRQGPHLFIRQQVFSFDGELRKGNGQAIRFTTTRPHFGGERFWLLCECGRRSGCLYLPNGETVFRCRPCYDLTYQATQEHNTRTAKLRKAIEFAGGAIGVFEPGARRTLR